MTGYVHSIQSLGTLDGPGVRAVIFTTGCPLRCIYCHNPDTWQKEYGTVWESDELVEKILRLYPYIKHGGVTFSGGEPLVQAEFLTEVAKKLRGRGLHVALDTSGAVLGPSVDALLEVSDLVLLDVKFTDDESYKLNTGVGLSKILAFLDKLEALGKDVWIRHVVVPGINDSESDVLALARLLKPYKCIKKTELLPFKKLCLEKYEKLGIEFPLKGTPQMDTARLLKLYDVFSSEIGG